MPLLALLLTGCQTQTFGTRSSVIDAAVKPQIRAAVCENLVPIAGSKHDTGLSRRQHVRQNARVMRCPPELRRKPDLS